MGRDTDARALNSNEGRIRDTPQGIGRACSQHGDAPGRASGPQVGRRRPEARRAARAPHANLCRQSLRPRRTEDEQEPAHHQTHDGRSSCSASTPLSPARRDGANGLSLPAGGLIFAMETGTIINPSNLRNRSFKALLKKAGLPPIRFHDLRHTCDTLLLSKDINAKVVSEMLGHSSINVTLDIYLTSCPTCRKRPPRPGRKHLDR